MRMLMKKTARKGTLLLLASGAISSARAETVKPGAASGPRCVPQFEEGRLEGYRCEEIPSGSP